ncbi:hypothetical protein UPYG_G00114720 [Umbra pygmaea]|uniref:Putative monooxygenase p33MONOX n=1 Tax=Umbra pygmaea TaxID=75934 RepID=A0ABD0XNU1_UMBPY
MMASCASTPLLLPTCFISRPYYPRVSRRKPRHYSSLALPSVHGWIYPNNTPLSSVTVQPFAKMSRSGDLPALESGTSDGLMGGMSLPIGMTRRAMSYDDNMEAPMSEAPSDININNLWGRRPLVPDRKFKRLAEEDESTDVPPATFESAHRPHMPVIVKAKASSVIMNSLMTKQTQDSMSKFEQHAGLRDTGYTPHKGLTAEETRHHHRMPDSFHKMNIQSLDMGGGPKGGQEDKQTSSAQSTPNSTPQSSPKQKRRGWFTSQSSSASVTSSDLSTSSNTSVDMVTAEGGGAVERWGIFGPRPLVQKPPTEPGTDHINTGGFALQPYRGAQKPTPMEVMKAQGSRLADDSTLDKQAPPKMEIPTMEGSRRSARPHKLKHRDMNVLTPSGF